ncbi:Sensor protein FixL [Hartmannibacter diazotrophicus]|uniref:histidine kinase n=1 Tax=Hartmannibacter diazotrophicus TaxID=1482074 RepID=A0A2C9D185_9HYPH|nr:PAS domain S-box protein [Hartmannibacter diazotrophicus]SON54006.1 Sensor protein FixL [Hartmannibacter diazotrophicus]
MDKRPASHWRGTQGNKGAGRPRDAYRILAAVTLSGVIFAIDSLTSLRSAVAVLYVVVIVLAADVGKRSSIIIASAGCAALTIGSYAYVHGLDGEDQALLRFLFSLAANAVITVLLLRRRSDLQMVEAQARLLEVTSDAIFVRDAEGRIIFWNTGAETLFGWPAEEALGLKAEEILDVTFPASRSKAEAELDERGQWEGECRIRARDGRHVDVSTRWFAEQGLRDYSRVVLEASVDITARKASEAALKASETRYRTIFETLAVAILEHDFSAVKADLTALRQQGIGNLRRYLAEHPEFVRAAREKVRITDVNPAAAKMVGATSKSEFFERLDDFLSDDNRSFANCLIALDEGQPFYQAEAVVRSLDGGTVPVIVLLTFPRGEEGFDRVLGSIVDISERLRFQEALDASRSELENASRAAMIGEISASIAHEVNQPLAAIMTFVQAAQRWLNREDPDLDEAKFALNEAVNATEHASAVVRRVRMLLGKAKSQDSEVAFDDVINDAVRAKESELSDNDVAVKLDLKTDGIQINGDRILLQQAFMNIIVNAIQAMEATPADRRSLTISASADGSALCVRFSDSGPGLSEGTSAEGLFKAFQTTKPNGMGLGLAMCRSIATAHNGKISIGNRDDGPGAVIELRLPHTQTRSAEAGPDAGKQ